MNDELTKSLSNAQSHEEINAALDAIRQGTVTAEEPQTKKPEPQPVQSPTFKRTEIIGGKEFEFEGESESDVNRAILNAHRLASAIQEPTPQIEPASQTADDPARTAIMRSELELQWRRGEISSEQYLQQSGAIENYLASQGVDLAELRSNLDEGRQKREAQSWSDATQEFLRSNSDWQGGGRNLQLVSLKLQSLGLANASDKVAALEKAWGEMKRTGTYFPAESSKSAPNRSTPVRESQKSQQVDIDPNASPAEILEAWRQGVTANGKDPNEAFTEQFGGKKTKGRVSSTTP